MIKTARQKLHEFLQNSGKSQKQVAKETGLSSAVISQFLAGVYSGDNSEVAAKITQYLSVGVLRLNRIEKPGFCPELHNAQQVMFAARFAHHNNKIAMVYGAAGAGKTTALKHYAANNPGVIYVTANACTQTARAILYMISEALGKIPTGSVFLVMRDLVAALRNTNRLIIIDEADHLSLKALQAVRNLYDEAGVGLLLSGNERIKNQMYGRGSSQFDQLRSRVSCKKQVDNDYSMAEIQMMFPMLREDCQKHLLVVARMESLRTAVERYMFAAQCAAAQQHALTVDYLRQSEMLQLEAV